MLASAGFVCVPPRHAGSSTRRPWVSVCCTSSMWNAPWGSLLRVASERGQGHTMKWDDPWDLPAGQVVTPSPQPPSATDLDTPITPHTSSNTSQKVTPRESYTCMNLKENGCYSIEIACKCEFLGRHFREEFCGWVLGLNSFNNPKT